MELARGDDDGEGVAGRPLAEAVLAGTRKRIATASDGSVTPPSLADATSSATPDG